MKKILFLLMVLILISGCSLELSKTGKAYSSNSLMGVIERDMFKNGIFDGYVVVGKGAPAVDAVTASTILLKLNDALGNPEEIPTNIDYSRTDEEVNIGDNNLIVVGAPCDNKLIRELLDISKCEDFFSEDLTYIDYHSTGRRNVLLITGKKSSTIRANAIEVFSNPNRYNLKYPAIIHNLNNIEFKEYVPPEPEEEIHEEQQIEEQEKIEPKEELKYTQEGVENQEQTVSSQEQEPNTNHQEPEKQDTIVQQKKENIFKIVINWFSGLFRK